MRVKLGLLSTVIALCLGQAYSAEVQNEVKQTQEKELDVNKSIRECREILKDIVSATEELSEKNIELLGILPNTYFEDIDDFTKMNTENTKQLLLLGSKIFEADKMLNEIADTYNPDARKNTTDKIELVRNNLKGVAEKFENMSRKLKNAAIIVPTNENKLQLAVMNILHMYLNIETKFSSVLHKLYMLKIDINLKRWTQIAKELTVEISSTQDQTAESNTYDMGALDKYLTDFIKKLESKKRKVSKKTTKSAANSEDYSARKLERRKRLDRLTSDEASEHSITRTTRKARVKKTTVEMEEAK